MKFVSVRELRGQTADVWRRLGKERELVITSNGKPIGILSATDEDRLERSLRELRRARAMEAVKSLREASLRSGRSRLEAEDLEAEIAAVRRERRR
jgi:prevent-host-death family protein